MRLAALILMSMLFASSAHGGGRGFVTGAGGLGLSESVTPVMAARIGFELNPTAMVGLEIGRMRLPPGSGTRIAGLPHVLGEGALEGDAVAHVSAYGKRQGAGRASNPYLLGSAGVYRYPANRGTMTDTYRFGTSVGMGFEGAGRVAPLVELRLHTMATNDETPGVLFTMMFGITLRQTAAATASPVLESPR